MGNRYLLKPPPSGHLRELQHLFWLQTEPPPFIKFSAEEIEVKAKQWVGRNGAFKETWVKTKPEKALAAMTARSPAHIFYKKGRKVKYTRTLFSLEPPPWFFSLGAICSKLHLRLICSVTQTDAHTQTHKSALSKHKNSWLARYGWLLACQPVSGNTYTHTNTQIVVIIIIKTGLSCCFEKEHEWALQR